jgi:hypothetical protein
MSSQALDNRYFGQEGRHLRDWREVRGWMPPRGDVGKPEALLDGATQEV